MSHKKSSPRSRQSARRTVVDAPVSYGATLIGYTPTQWRDTAKYPPPDTTSMRRWAAEFLIRNSDFQNALADLRGLQGPKNDPESPYRNRLRKIGEQFGFLRFGPLITWSNDELVMYPGLFRTAPYTLESCVRLHGASGEWFLGQDEGWGAALVFDLRRPVAPQLRVAEKILKGIKRIGVSPLGGAQRNRRANYQAMLRVLDARFTGVIWTEIAKAIFPEKDIETATDHVKKLHRRGARLRDEGYRHLPSLSSGALSTRP